MHTSTYGMLIQVEIILSDIFFYLRPQIRNIRFQITKYAFFVNWKFDRSYYLKSIIKMFMALWYSIKLLLCGYFVKAFKKPFNISHLFTVSVI